MATFQFKNSDYSVSPPQSGSRAIVNRLSAALTEAQQLASWQQVITDIPASSTTGISVSIVDLAVFALQVSVSTVETANIPLQNFMLQQYSGFALLNINEDGAISSRDALLLLRMSSGVIPWSDRLKHLVAELEEVYETFKDNTINGKKLFIGTPLESRINEGFFDPTKHYIVVDEDDPTDRLKLIKYHNKNNVAASYWFDTGTGSELEGLTTLNTRGSKAADRSQITATNQHTFDGSSASIVSAANDTIQINNHGLITNDVVVYDPGSLHTFDASDSSIVDITNNKFIIEDHGYNTGDIIKYGHIQEGSVAVGPLVKDQLVYVRKLTDDEFQIVSQYEMFSQASCVVSLADETVEHPANANIVAGLAVFQENSILQVPHGTTVATITDSTHFEMSVEGNIPGTVTLLFGPILDLTSMGIGKQTFSGAYPQGLVDTIGETARQEFNVIEVSDNTFKLAANSTNADAGTAIDITAVGEGTKHTIGGNFTKEIVEGDFVGVFEEFTFNGETDVDSNQITIRSSVITDATCDTHSNTTVDFNTNTNIVAGMNVSGSGIQAGTKVSSVDADNQGCTLTKVATSSLTNTTLTFFYDHGFATGDTVDYSAGAGTIVGGLTEGQRYFVIRIDESTIKLSKTAADAGAGTAITLSDGAGVAHTLSLNYGTNIYRVKDSNKIFTTTSDGVVFTNRDLKVPNWTLDPAKDVIVAKVYSYETTGFVNVATSSSTSVNIDNINGELILPGAVVSQVSGGAASGLSGNPTVVTSTHTTEDTEGDITVDNAEIATVVLSTSQSLTDNGALVFKSYAVEPYVGLDSGDRVEDDVTPKLSADLDINGKNIVNDALSLKTSTGSKKLIVGNTNAVELYYNDGKTFETVTGGVQATGTMTASGNITAFSDERLKSGITTLDGKRVLEMRGVEFVKDGEKGSGVIAQELEKVAPELVSDKGEYKSVAYGNLVGYLIEAVKDLQKQVDELKK